jgi:dTMP kinase
MTSNRPGVLIAIEGIDGAGKSTLQRNLSSLWKARGYRVETLHEPFDPALGAEALRVTRKNPSWAALLFTLDRWAARPQLRALLAEPCVVLVDRSFYSTLAYQGSALPPTRRRELEDLQRSVAEKPDRVLLVDISPQEALRRVGQRGRRRTPPERIDFLRRVERAYTRMADQRNWVVLDGRQPAPELAADADHRLGPFLRRRYPRAGRHR